MRIIFENPSGQPSPDIEELLRKHFAWLETAELDEGFFARLANSTSEFMQKNTQMVYCKSGRPPTLVSIVGLRPMLTNSAVTFYPQFGETV